MSGVEKVKYLPVSKAEIDTTRTEANDLQQINDSNQTDSRDLKGCLTIIPMRVVLAILALLGNITFYTMRMNLSVAMVAMVGGSQRSLNEINGTLKTCPELIVPRNYSDLNDKENSGEFNWDSGIQGQILGSFYYGYIVTQIPGGLLAQRCGAKWIFGIGILVNAVFTLLTPIAARWSVWAVIAVRVIEGLAGGAVYPAWNVLVGRWVPKNERSRIMTCACLGILLGSVVANSVTGLICESTTLGGWPAAFYFFGSIGCVWFLFWAVLVYETPETHPFISKKELTYIQDNKDQTNYSGFKVPWKSIWTSLPMWALILAHVGHNWAFYALLTMTPTYLSNVLHFDIKNNGLLSALPFLIMAIFSFTASFVADALRASKRLHVTTIRKLMTSIAFFIPGTCIMIIAFIGCHPVAIIILLCISCGTNGSVFSGIIVNHVDMSPQFVGTLFGITNCLGTLPGFLAPGVIGLILKSGQTLENWSTVFIMTSAIYFTAGIIYDIFGSAELQPWNNCGGKGATKTAVVFRNTSSSANGKCSNPHESEDNISLVEESLTGKIVSR